MVAPQAFSLQDVIINRKEKTTPAKPPQPRGDVKAKLPTNGVLFVITDPPDAKVVIKDARGIVRANHQAKDGEFRAELPRGRYLVEVSASGYEAASAKGPVDIKPPQANIVQIELTPLTGSLVIGPVVSEALILLNGKKPEAFGAKINIKKNENQIEIENVPKGSYTIHIEQPNYLPLDRVNVRVEGGSVTTYTPVFREAVAELEVITDSSTKVYLDNMQIGETSPEGRLRWPNVKIGTHEIHLVRDDCEDYKETFVFEAGKRVVLEKKLTPKATSAAFTDDFAIGMGKWTAPPTGFSRKAGRLEVANATTVAFATGYNYRDFYMTFYLKMVNDGGAAWAVRVKDTSNYYLFYLSGPGGLFPKRFNAYIVRDNKFDPQNPIVSFSVLPEIKAGGEYTIEINASGSEITHKITPAATGVTENLGVFKDPNNLFTIGSIGFRSVASEVFSVDDIIVQPPR